MLFAVDFESAEMTKVLILIVLDHLIMPTITLVENEGKYSLNPYCIGSSNHALMPNYQENL